MKINRPNRFRCMLRDARWTTRNAPVRLASMTFSNRSSVIRMRNASAETPALDTTTSTGPWCSSIALKARSTASLSVTSHSTPNSPSGAPDPRCVTATLWPSAASRCAIARPIPRFPPVTRTEPDTNAGLAPLAGESASSVAVSVTRPTYRLGAAGPTSAPPRVEVGSGRQPRVDEQRRQRRGRQYQRTQAQPAHTGIAFDGLVADLLLQGRVDG